MDTIRLILCPASIKSIDNMFLLYGYESQSTDMDKKCSERNPRQVDVDMLLCTKRTNRANRRFSMGLPSVDRNPQLG